MKNYNTINNNKTEEKSLNQKSPLNFDINYLKQDILFFKNDVLKDIRKLEEKLSLKFSEQEMENIEKYDVYEKKIENLSNKLTHVKCLIPDSKNISEKIVLLESFKTKAENDFFSINSKINSIQKESKESYYKYEKLINENLQYPGIIGNNAKFPSFRLFIDFVLNNIKLLNDFKDEVNGFELNEYKKKLNSEIQNLKFNINENYRNSRIIIEENIKETNNKLIDYNIKFTKKFEQNNEKMEKIENRINEYFDDYQTKINLIEEDLKNKYIKQITEIENIKNVQKQYTNNSIENEININYTKSNKKKKRDKSPFDKNNLHKKDSNKNNEIIDNNRNFKKILYNNLKEIKSSSSDSINLKQKDYEKMVDKNNNNNNNNNIININNNNNYKENIIQEQKILDFIKNDVKININYKEMKNDTDNIIENKFTKISISKLPKTTRINLYNKISNNKNKINFEDLNNNNNNDDYDSQNSKYNLENSKKNENNSKEEKNNKNIELKKKIQKLNFNVFQKYPKKNIFQNNYSITNIPNIEFKKILIPDPFNSTNNFNSFYKTSLSDNYFKTIRSSFPICKKSSLSDNQENLFTKINNNNIYKIKNIKRMETVKLKNTNRIGLNQKNNKFDSLKVIHIKNKNHIFNSSKKHNNKSLSYEKYKNDKGSYIASKIGKINKSINKFKEMFNNKYEDLYDKKK